MKYIDTIYEHYFDIKTVEGEETEKNNEEKWFNLVIKERAENFSDFLKLYEESKNIKVYGYIKKFQDMIIKNIDKPLDLLEGKRKADFFDTTLDVMCEEIENKDQEEEMPKEYRELLAEFNRYYTFVEEWLNLAFIDRLGKDLLESETFGEWEYISELVDDIDYYNSIRSNPNISHVEESKTYLKGLIKHAKGKKKILTEDEKDILLSYLTHVQDYLDALSYMLEMKNKKNKKSK